MGIEYFNYGSKLDTTHCGEGVKEAQPEIKNSPNFYQEAPFLTIAEDLLKLIKEDKVEELTFLTANDEKRFPMGDVRKKEMFSKTFGNVGMLVGSLQIKLLGFHSETQGQS